ncbi:MAG: hypothetical protein AAF481_00705 [Acidobacteriota bacterium]
MGQNRHDVPALRRASRRSHWRRSAGGILAFLIASASAGNVSAATTDLEALYVAPDIHLVVGGVEIRDHQVLADDLAGGLMQLTLGGLPEAAAIDALHRLDDGRFLFSLEGWADLGGLPVGPADIVSWDGTSYGIAFDAAAAGLPAGLDVDALSFDADDIFLSFQTHADLPGGPYADDDLVRWDGASFSLAFDGAAAGVPRSLDLDAAHRLENGNWLLSFDSDGTVGGVGLADEDVVEHDPVAGSWELLYDGSTFFPAWEATDLVALTAGEPPNVLEIPVLSPIGLTVLAMILALSASAIVRRRMPWSAETDFLEKP